MSSPAFLPLFPAVRGAGFRPLWIETLSLTAGTAGAMRRSGEVCTADGSLTSCTAGWEVTPADGPNDWAKAEPAAKTATAADVKS